MYVICNLYAKKAKNAKYDTNRPVLDPRFQGAFCALKDSQNLGIPQPI